MGVGVGDAARMETGCPEKGWADTEVGMVDRGTLAAAEAEQLVGHRYCAHVGHECWASLQKQGSSTEECDI